MGPISITINSVLVLDQRWARCGGVVAIYFILMILGIFALVVAAVILARVLTQAARRYWYYHYEQQLHLEFPPDRLVIFLCNMIRAHRTLPCFLELERLEQKKNMSLNYVQTEEQELFP